MSNGLVHSNPGKHTKQKFLEKFNDFNLYVEDEGYEYWYKEIFKRMGFNLVSVVASGDKYKLIDDYRSYGNKESSGKLNFFLTDGDFWRYNNPEKMILEDCFIYLETYNIESYFIDKSYSMLFLKGRLQTDEKGVLASGFNFDNWRNRIVEESKEQFLVYAALEAMSYSLSNTNPQFSQSIGKTVKSAKTFLNHNSGFIDEHRWSKNSNRILQIISDNKISEDYDKVFHEIEERYKSINGDEYYNLICGKYLFYSLTCYIKSILKSKSVSTTIINEDFKWGCINSFDISKLDYVKSKIIKHLSA